MLRAYPALLGAPLGHARGELPPEALRQLLRRALEEPGTHARHGPAHLGGGVPPEAGAVRGHRFDREPGADVHPRARRPAAGRQLQALGRRHLGQLDIELELELHAPDAERRHDLEVPVAACSKLAYAMPAPLGGPGSRISTSNSPGFRTVVNGPLKNFRAGTERLPPLDCSTNVASRTSMTGGMSAAGSACARPPPIVPALRTCRSPMCSVTSAISGYFARSGLESSSSR